MGHKKQKKQKKHKCHKSDREHSYEPLKLRIFNLSSSNNVAAIQKRITNKENRHENFCTRGLQNLRKSLSLFTLTSTSSAPVATQSHTNCKPSNFQLFLGSILKKLETKDDLNLFSTPVTDEIAPLYSTMISHPMDFSTMKNKINQNLYKTIASFQHDVKLIFDNAMLYNAPETIYYQRAKKLWRHAESKIFTKKALIKSSRLYRGLCATIEYELEKKANAEVSSFESADNNMTVGLPMHPDSIQSQQDCDMEKDATMVILPVQSSRGIKNLQGSCVDTLKLANNENVELNKTETTNDGELTAEQILAHVGKQAKKVTDRIKYKRSHLSLLRPKNDGTTTLNIISEVKADEVKEKIVTLGSLVGPLSDGISCLPSYKEPEENHVNLLESVTTEPFSSFLPSVDSTRANLTQEETQLLRSTYGEDDTCLQFTQSILSFANDNDYTTNMVEQLLESLTDGQNSETMHKLRDLQINKDKEQEQERNENKTEAEKEKIYIYKLDLSDISSDDSEPEDTSFESILNELEPVNTQHSASFSQPVSLPNDKMKLTDLLCDKITTLLDSQDLKTTTEPAAIHLGDFISALEKKN